MFANAENLNLEPQTPNPNQLLIASSLHFDNEILRSAQNWGSSRLHDIVRKGARHFFEPMRRARWDDDDIAFRQLA